MAVNGNILPFNGKIMAGLGQLCLAVLAILTATEACPSSCRCDRLNTVDCSSVGLTTLPDLTASSWPRGAHRLLLQKNRLKTIAANAFLTRSLTNLTVIDLSSNLLEEIEPRAFSGLHNLELLDLRYNQLRSLGGHSFSRVAGKGSTPEGCRIDLRYNDLQIVEDNAFAWVKDLSLRFGESAAKMTIKQYAFYSMRNVPDITISGVGELTIAPRAFTNFVQLGKMEVSNTTITSISNFTFEGLTGLGGLVLDRCTIKGMAPYAFSGITYANDVSAVPDASGQSGNFTNGGYFVLSNSRFDALPTYAFRDTNLVSVSLTNNTMNNINGFAFRDMQNVRVINIKNNSLEKLSTNSLATIKKLDELILHGNKISSIESYAFRESGSIKTLSIGHQQDVELTLQPNAFSQLYEVDFFEITNLSKLIISPNAFKDVQKVKTLRIENVFVPTLQKDAFSGLRLVQSFNIAYCNVTTIQPGLFGQESMSRGAIVNFDMSKGNTIHCDCNIRQVLSEFQFTFSKHRPIECVRRLENGTTVPVTLQEVPVCAGCVISRNTILLIVVTVLTAFLT